MKGGAMSARTRIPRSLAASDLSQANLGRWLEELGFKVRLDEENDLGFDLTPYFSSFLLIGEDMVEILILQSFDHLDEAVALKIANQLNSRRFTLKWMVRDDGTVMCAYRFDWQGRVSFAAFARILRIVGAQALRGYQWMEQADQAARRYKEEQESESSSEGEVSDTKDTTHGDAADATTGPQGTSKLLH